jgi:DNA-binding NarL/FixJ family response regulator
MAALNARRYRACAMSPRKLRILHLEDDVADSAAVEAALAGARIECDLRRVTREDAFMQALREFHPDAVLSDHALTEFDALAAVRAIRAVRPTIPLIVVSGTFNEDAIVRALKAGAVDYVFKGNLSRLAPAVAAAVGARRALERLTPRQLDVLRLLAEGCSTSEMAQRLALSIKTVETHRAELMRRLDIHDVARLVRYAVRIGLVPTEP